MTTAGPFTHVLELGLVQGSRAENQYVVQTQGIPTSQLPVGLMHGFQGIL